MKSILDEIYTRILEAGRGFSEQEILRDFFKIELASDDMASRIVSPLLKGDARFVQGTDRAWSAVKKVSLEELPVSETPFILFAIDDLERRTPASSLHVFAREYAGEGPAAPDDMREAPIDREAVVPPDRMPNVEGDPFFLLKECSAFIVYKNGVVLSDISIRDVLKKAHQYVFLPHDAKSLARLKKVSRSISPLSPDLKTLSIRTLISLLYPEKRLKTWDDIVKEFSIVSLQSDRPGSRVLTLKYIFEFLLLALQSRGLTKLGDLFEFQQRAAKKVDFSRYGFDRAFLRDIPEMPGVYLFRDRGGRVIYVGKASNLKVRISSYFWDTGESVGKIEGILEKLSTIEYRVLGSDLEAMIEEYRLIDEYGPHFNTKVKIPERQVEVPDRILILPSSMQGMLKLYVLSDVLPLQELDYDCAGAGDGPIIDLLKKIQDSRKKAVGHGDNLPGDEVPRNEVPMAFDPLKVIALFYLRRYDESLNSIDIDRYRSPEEVVRALRMHCKNLDALFREKTTYIET